MPRKHQPCASESRIAYVLAAIGNGLESQLSLSIKTGFSRPSVHYCLMILRSRNHVEIGGSKPNPAGGGRRVMLWRLATGAPPVIVERFEKRISKPAMRDSRPQSQRYRGKPAGKIVIGRGSFWGAGLV